MEHEQTEKEERKQNADQADDTVAELMTSSRDKILPTTTESDSSLTCRICQCGETDDEGLESTNCDCRGSISRIHRHCLVEWVSFQRSNQCELCGSRFRRIRVLKLATRESAEESDESAELALLPCYRSRRRWFCLAFVILLLATAASAALTFLTMETYEDAWYEHWHHMTPLTNLEGARFNYNVSLGLLVFFACICVAVLLLWVFLEMQCPARNRDINNRPRPQMPQTVILATRTRPFTQSELEV